MTGLVAQQQCVGPLHTPLADVAVVALSPLGLEGAATAIGEQPVKALVNAAAGARMAVGEALTNLMFARVTALKVSRRLGVTKQYGGTLKGRGGLSLSAVYRTEQIISQQKEALNLEKPFILEYRVLVSHGTVQVSVFWSNFCVCVCVS